MTVKSDLIHMATISDLKRNLKVYLTKVRSLKYLKEKRKDFLFYKEADLEVSFCTLINLAPHL